MTTKAQTNQKPWKYIVLIAGIVAALLAVNYSTAVLSQRHTVASLDEATLLKMSDVALRLAESESVTQGSLLDIAIDLPNDDVQRIITSLKCEPSGIVYQANENGEVSWRKDDALCDGGEGRTAEFSKSDDSVTVKVRRS